MESGASNCCCADPEWHPNRLSRLLPPEHQVVATLLASGLAPEDLSQLQDLKPSLDELFDIVESSWFESKVYRIVHFFWDGGWLRIHAAVVKEDEAHATRPGVEKRNVIYPAFYS